MFTRETGDLRRAVSEIDAARGANNLERWTHARTDVERRLGALQRSLERARSRSHDATPQLVEQLAEAERELEQLHDRFRGLGEAPTGFTPIATEADILATCEAPLDGGYRLSFDKKEGTLKAQFDRLTPVDRRVLAERLRKPRANDPLATAFGRFAEARRNSLLSHLTHRRNERGQQPALTGRAATAGDTTRSIEEEPESLDTKLRRTLEGDLADDALEAAFAGVAAGLDGTSRRELARRLETHRPGNGDDIGARFIRLDRTIRARICAELRGELGGYPLVNGQGSWRAQDPRSVAQQLSYGSPDMRGSGSDGKKDSDRPGVRAHANESDTKAVIEQPLTPGKLTRVDLEQGGSGDTRAAALLEKLQALSAALPGKLADAVAAVEQAVKQSPNLGENLNALASVLTQIAGPNKPAVPTQSGDSGGRPLPDQLRTHMEAAFGVDLSAVRVHTDSAAAEAVGAQAYAQGNDVHFAPGKFDPSSQTGLELIGHELTHVIKPAQDRPQHKGAIVEDPALEHEADVLGARAARGERVDVTVGASGNGVIQRKPQPNTAAPSNAPTPIVRVDQPATTKPFPRQQVTADEYLGLWVTELLDVMMRNLGQSPPAPHTRLRWTDASNAAALIAATLDMSRKRFASDDRGLLVRLFYPLDLHALVDRYRDLRPPPPGHEAQGPTGKLDWQTAIGDSIAAEARPRLHEAIARMGQRYVAAADALHAKGVRAELAIKTQLAAENAILPHTPLDYIVLLAMRDPVVVTYTPPNAKSPREVANNDLRGIGLTCMGARDPALWNVVRADTPGTTVEQVAAVLFNRGDDATAHTYDADLIVDAAPYYILPKSWAATLHQIAGQAGPAAYEPEDEKKHRELERYNPEATQRANAKAGPDPRTVLAESTLADEIALAQNEIATQHQAGSKPIELPARRACAVVARPTCCVCRRLLDADGTEDAAIRCPERVVVEPAHPSRAAVVTNQRAGRLVRQRGRQTGGRW